ncbi:Zinc C2H2 [Cordyceps militaris]|uniref:Zinc C2H2 n=1 Tax=Cordyceps militaris TaxID=73501 RepID=A0A2H4S8S6_CORMI|nr:Zinc C2H2 [Cordyceps militaris]
MEPAGKRPKLAPKLNASASSPSGPRSGVHQQEQLRLCPIVPDVPHHSQRPEFEAFIHHLHNTALCIKSSSDAVTPDATRTRDDTLSLTPGPKLTFDEARVLVCTTFVGDDTPNASAFESWLHNTLPLAAQTTIEGIFLGPPTVLFLSMSTSLWASVQHDTIWIHLGNITSRNLASRYNKMAGAPATSTAVTETSTATTTAPEAAKDERPNGQTSPTAKLYQSRAASGPGDAAANTSSQRAALPVAMPPLQPGIRIHSMLGSGIGSTGSRMRRILKKPDIQCARCSHTPFKDASSLRKHIAAAHTRPFPCVFRFAGCTVTLGSRNEWKRHIASQHLCLEYYRCSICPETTADGKDIEFNRKDLFTQHLWRIHAPLEVKALAKGDNSQQQSEWDSYTRDMQTTCFIQRRRPPQRSSCPKPGCITTFEGPTSWNEWMEHVGRHMEKGEGENLGVDDLFLRYALDKGIIEKVGEGYKLCKSQLQEVNHDVAARKKDEGQRASVIDTKYSLTSTVSE